MGYEARYVFIQAPSTEVLLSRLQEQGRSAEEAQAAASAAETLNNAKPEGFDKVIVNGDLASACGSLEAFIYGMEEKPQLTNGSGPIDTGMEGMEKAENDAAVRGVP